MSAPSWTRERGRWFVEYRNKVWTDEEVAAAQALDLESEDEGKFPEPVADRP